MICFNSFKYSTCSCYDHKIIIEMSERCRLHFLIVIFSVVVYNGRKNAVHIVIFFSDETSITFNDIVIELLTNPH